jgi:hypothetical protein
MANWKKVLVSGSNISELNNDAGYLKSQGSNLVSSSAQVTLGGVLTGTADNAAYSASSITNVAIAPNAAIAYSKLDLAGSGILSGSIDFSALVTTSSFNSYTSSNDAKVTLLESSASAAATSIEALNLFTASVDVDGLVTTSSFNTYTGSVATSIDALNIFTGSVATSFVTTSSFNTYTGSVDTFSGSLSTRVTTLEASASKNDALSSSFEARLTADEVKYNAYTSSFTTETLIVTSNAAVTGTFGVQGNTSFGANVIVEGNLTVNGTASFVNVEELSIKDKFITLASGSNSLTDAGIIFQSSTTGVGSGPALFLEATSTGTSGRMAMATSVDVNATAATPSAYVNTTEVSIGFPVNPPIFGDATNGFGNMFVNSVTGDIFIYA